MDGDDARTIDSSCSEAPRGGSSRVLKRIATAVALLAMIVLGIMAVNFALYPYGSKSQLSWDEFRQQQDLDTVCLGTSLGLRSFDPAVVDEGLGTKSFNMCTPGQTVRESVLGLEEALEHHRLKRVFYAIDYAQLWLEPEQGPRRVYLDEKWKGEGLAQRASDMAYILSASRWPFTEKSLNWLFPWTEQHANFDLVADNVRMKLEGTPLPQASERIEKGWHYFGRGYGNYYGVYDYNRPQHHVYADLGMRALSADDLVALGDFCDRCTRAGVELVVYVPPLSDIDFLSLAPCYDGYYHVLSQFVAQHGAAYYDFNLARRNLFDSREDLFENEEHLNVEGATQLSRALVQVAQSASTGQDVTGLFATYDEKRAEIDGIVVTFLQATCDQSQVQLSASCYAGSRVKPEYQFLVATPGQEFQVVQDYSPADACRFASPGRGAFTVRVNARPHGSQAGFEKFAERELVCP